MCGITGFLGSDHRNEEIPAILERMTGVLTHRGPDDNGTWVDAEARVALGHRRLSIIDLARTGHQPMISHSGRYVLTYNGEIYNFRDLRERLEAQGSIFRGTSDTEVLLAAIERWGVAATLPVIQGMFAFAVWDRKLRTLSLARDRFGKKPLYLGWVGKTFLFSSELKSFKVHPDFVPDIDRNALALYLRHGCVPNPLSIYENVHKLKPGTFVQVRVGDPGNLPEPTSYWSVASCWTASRESVTAPSHDAVVNELDRRLGDAVESRLVADVPLGAFLSGGIDSSLVVALMQQRSSQQVRTFTIGFDEAQYDEAPYARQVAQLLGTDHTELYVRPAEAMAVVPQLSSMYDEPFADSSQIPTYLLSRMCREHVKVALAGDGGDEFFGGYLRHQVAYQLARRNGRLSLRARRAGGRILEQVPAKCWDRILPMARPLLPRALRGPGPGSRMQRLAEILALEEPEDIHLRLISVWQRPSEVVVGADGLSSWLDLHHLERLRSPVSSAMYFDSLTYLSDDILTKVDRASMAVSLEVRAPFLDADVVSFATALPPGVHFADKRGKYLLRSLLHRHLPKQLVDRPKMGFGVPIDTWLRGPLRGWLTELLDARRLTQEGFFHPRPIQEALRQHLSGERDRRHELWAVAMFQIWLESSESSSLVAS